MKALWAISVTLLLMVGGFLGWQVLQTFDHSSEPVGRSTLSVSIQDAQSAPSQKNYNRSTQNKMRFVHEGYDLTPIASFDISARVLSRKNYRFGREADLSPVDLALGWGRMSNIDVIKDVKISQRGRFYFWRAPSRNKPIPISEIIRSSANMHLVPSGSDVERQIRGIEKNDIVRIKGYLVNVKHKDGWRWGSSTSRTDTGNGACELIFVTEVVVL